MKKLSFKNVLLLTLSIIALVAVAAMFVIARFTPEAVDFEEVNLDPQIRQFLESDSWRGKGTANVPAVDGQTLHDIVLEKRYTRALEIGTSTGHSAVWIASALKKTGGKLITVEINEARYRQALKNFEAAGVSEYVDARLGNAHEIVPSLEGGFDFVFSDADKGWYKNYLIAVLPKLEVGGCYTTHNVSTGLFSGWFSENSDYLDYLTGLPYMETKVDIRGRGLSISYKLSNVTLD
jgi:predicted O-methyltransferase YrrM